ncbi:MAG TPA: rhodanese-like domain-containing protein [Polyangia bacterium]|nr:rhodanese-like domain-containing protein [Polyangia bacterium]
MSDATDSIATIDRAALQAKLTRGDRFKLVMAASDWAFRAKHIPGSVHYSRTEDLFAAVGLDEEIVVYCSNVDCHASLGLIQKLRAHGYHHVLHYAGGLIDWEGADLPIEGDWAGEARHD